MSQLIIGITGTLGAGKGAVVDMLVEKHGFAHYSVRAYLTKEVEKRGLPVDRASLVAMGNELRERHGAAYIMQELYKEAAAGGKNAIIESVRTTGEVAFLRSLGNFFLLAVDADRGVRYARIRARASKTDSISFTQFLADEERESTSPESTKQNLPACIALADRVVMNDGTLDELENNVEGLLNEISG